MRVSEGVHQVMGSLGSNAWVLEDAGGVTLVDAGGPGTERPILECIRGLGRPPESLSTILLTHGHPDHYGGAARLQAETGARVLAHGGDVRADRRGALRLRYTWAPRVAAPTVDGLVEDGQVYPALGGLRALHTPGHTPGSVSFYLEGRGLLFTGDTLLSDGRFFRRPFPLLPGSRWADYRRSLHRLADLRFESAFPGHGRAILHHARQRLLEYVRLRYAEEGPLWWRTVRHVPLLSRAGARVVTRGWGPRGGVG